MFPWLQDTSAVKTIEEEVDVTFDPIVADNSCPPQPKHKLFKEQRNMSRKRDLKWTERPDRRDEVDKRGSITAPHVVEVDVEIKKIDNAGVGDNHEALPHPVQQSSKRKSTTPQRVRRKPRANHAPAPTVSSSPSRASIISDTAAEELCDLRNYYSKQLRRINYISHEYLGEPAEPGVLACIREPLRSLRLPRRLTVAQTARSLWTRVSGRRKLGHVVA